MTLRSRMLLRLASLLGASLEDVANDAELMEAVSKYTTMQYHCTETGDNDVSN